MIVIILLLVGLIVGVMFGWYPLAAVCALFLVLAMLFSITGEDQ